MSFARALLRNWTMALGIVLLAAVFLMALTANFVFPGDPYDMVGPPLMWPGEYEGALLGTDSLGRDIAAGIFYGSRVSLLVGFSSVAVAMIVGVLVGAFAGFYGGWVDDVLMRVTELFQTIPQFMLAIVVVAVLGPSIGPESWRSSRGRRSRAWSAASSWSCATAPTCTAASSPAWATCASSSARSCPMPRRSSSSCRRSWWRPPS